VSAGIYMRVAQGWPGLHFFLKDFITRTPKPSLWWMVETLLETLLSLLDIWLPLRFCALETVQDGIILGVQSAGWLDIHFTVGTSCERAAPLAEKNAAAQHHVLRSLISLHNEHRIPCHTKCWTVLCHKICTETGGETGWNCTQAKCTIRRSYPVRYQCVWLMHQVFWRPWWSH
jgi:hypothetical protein